MHDNHDANCLTFHRISDARSRTMANSVPMPELPRAQHEIGDFVVTGRNFEIGTLTAGEKAFSNRDYVWDTVPDALRNNVITRGSGGGVRAEITVTAKRDATFYLATALSQPGVRTQGWQRTAVYFRYTDAKKTALTVFRRDLKAGESVTVPQGNWTGSLVILPTSNLP